MPTIVSSNMTKTCICVFALFVIGIVVEGVESQSAQCNKWGVQFNEGQKITVPQQCMQATCVSGQENDIALSLCPRFKIRSECYLGKEDLKQSYPNCCPQPVCPIQG